MFIFVAVSCAFTLLSMMSDDVLVSSICVFIIIQWACSVILVYLARSAICMVNYMPRKLYIQLYMCI